MFLLLLHRNILYYKFGIRSNTIPWHYVCDIIQKYNIYLISGKCTLLIILSTNRYCISLIKKRKVILISEEFNLLLFSKLKYAFTSNKDIHKNVSKEEQPTIYILPRLFNYIQNWRKYYKSHQWTNSYPNTTVLPNAYAILNREY